MKTMQHTVEKIGGTSMSDYYSVRENIVLQGEGVLNGFNRVFVVSAYSGITDKLLEHKKTGQPGIYAFFSKSMEGRSWCDAVDELRSRMKAINSDLFGQGPLLEEADRFIETRLDQAVECLGSLLGLCSHGHFSLNAHLDTVREMLSSLGEAHSAWNMAQLLSRDGIPARFVDLTGWQTESHQSLDERILEAFKDVDPSTEFPIVTGYAHSRRGLMKTFDRGYSEMTFSRLAVLTGAREAVIHKEFHLSSADPGIVGESAAVPIGQTNYDVADQLAYLGMEAIHPKAA